MFRVAALLSAVLTVVLLAVTLVSATLPQPRSPGETLFSDACPRGIQPSGCQTPCLLGVCRGQQVQVAIDSLRVHPLTSRLTMLYSNPEVWFHGDSMRIELTLDAQGYVQAIQLYLFSFGATGLVKSQLVTFGEILEIWGAPSSVKIAPSRSGAFVAWEYTDKHALVESWVDTPYLLIDDWAYYVGINAGLPSLDELEPTYYFTPRIHRWYTIPTWLGFASFRRYMTDPTCTFRNPEPGPDTPCQSGG